MTGAQTCDFVDPATAKALDTDVPRESFHREQLHHGHSITPRAFGAVTFLCTSAAMCPTGTVLNVHGAWLAR